MSWFSIIIILLFLLSVIYDGYNRHKLSNQIEELQMVLHGFNFQIIKLEEAHLKGQSNATKIVRKTVAKEAK